MNDKLAETIIAAIERLGMTVDRVWPQMVLYTWTVNVFWAIVSPLLIVVSMIVAIRSFRRGMYLATKPHQGFNDNTDVGGMLMICGGLFLVIFAIVLLIFWPSYVAGALYPEAGAVMKMVGK